MRQLPDGSTLYLNTDSTVTVRYSGHERMVEVVRGQALFQVTHDTARRFRVQAGEAGAIAVGTRFDVYRQDSATLVTVAEGQVAVFVGQPSWLQNGRGMPPGVPLVGRATKYVLTRGRGRLSLFRSICSRPSRGCSTRSSSSSDRSAKWPMSSIATVAFRSKSKVRRCAPFGSAACSIRRTWSRSSSSWAPCPGSGSRERPRESAS